MVCIKKEGGIRMSNLLVQLLALAACVVAVIIIMRLGRKVNAKLVAMEAEQDGH